MTPARWLISPPSRILRRVAGWVARMTPPCRCAAGLGVVFVLLAELVLALFVAACFAVGVARPMESAPSFVPHSTVEATP